MAKVKDMERVAKALSCAPETVRDGLRHGALPFGTAWESGSSNVWVYVFYPERVKEYLGIELGRDEEES